ncbi:MULTISPECIES: hypothetical protein [Micromonospora]|uniref:Uncharacterized protein n=1 Tax=Micromonospora tulbaghiae TaxID=479978 RepID=A0A386WQS8_9ACTN|nr:hypothetical protein [Micromonospora tulbaghiae]AYF30541.1 hypothetical protein CSH63_24480 [Micromonospora tulbaghiae]
MSLRDTNGTFVAIQLALAALGVLLLVFGLRLAVTRRPYKVESSSGQPTSSEQIQAFRLSSGIALLGAGLLAGQVVVALDMPYLGQYVLFGVALLTTLGAVGLFLPSRS